MPLITLPSGKQFVANDGESLLDAALRSNVALPYSCRTGRCSSCKCQVISGSSKALRDELGLASEQQPGDWILSCVRTATSDVSLQVEDLSGIRTFAARTLPCRVQSLDLLAPDVMRVMLRLPASNAFDYLPGQYVDVIGTGGIRRSYSIANAPVRGQAIELHIRQVLDGVLSTYWFGQAAVQDLLRLHGPLGTFFLRDVVDRDLIFLATGTGIAPVKSILEALREMPLNSRPRSISVYWGGRQPPDLYWNPTTLELHLNFVPVLSRAAQNWAGARGHVQDLVLRNSHAWENSRVFACGSEAMINDARRQLCAAGLAPHYFHADSFVCSAAP